MSFYERNYYRGDGSGFGGGGGGFRGGFGLPKPSPMVTKLLIANFVIFLVQIITRGKIDEYFGVVAYQGGWIMLLQVWRLITFQFLHSVHMVTHIFFNMIGLYFLGPLLERQWGSRRFLIFYLTCGAVGGFLFTFLGTLGIGKFMGLLVGASGGVLGLLAACAILFPGITVILILFPVPIRAAATILIVMYTLNVLIGGNNAGGDLAHLGGMFTGIAWVMGRPYLERLKAKHQEGAWERKVEDERSFQFEVDRILAKVREQGIQSLTKKEKQMLAEATARQKRQGIV